MTRSEPTPPGLVRTWLMLPGDRPHDIGHLRLGAAEAIAIDLEHAVPDREKDAARDALIAALDPAHPCWVRVNAASGRVWRDDLEALGGREGVSGIILPQAERAADATATIRASGGLPVIALVESAIGLLAVGDLAAAGIVRIGFGTGDFRRDTGLDDNGLDAARRRIAAASAAAGIAAPIDGPPADTTPNGLRAHARHALEHGFAGCFCLRPEHAPALTAAFAAVS